MLRPEQVLTLRAALSEALHPVFAVLLGLALLGFLVMLRYAKKAPAPAVAETSVSSRSR